MEKFKSYKCFLGFLFFICWVSATLHAGRLKQGSVGFWFDIKSSGKFSDSKMSYLLQFQTKFKDFSYDQNVLRAGLGYRFKSCSTWLGCGFIPSFNKKLDIFEIENRIWQRVIFNIKTKEGIKLGFRTWLEERFKKNKCCVAFRLRQRFSIKVTKDPDRIHPFIYDEIFFNLNNPDWIGQKTINQNRIFVGVEVPIKDNWSLQIGYINQIQPKATETIMNHILSVSLTYK